MGKIHTGYSLRGVKLGSQISFALSGHGKMTRDSRDFIKFLTVLTFKQEVRP